MNSIKQDKIHRVALVLDSSFGNRLYELSKRTHVWAIESETNTGVANKIWEKNSQKNVQDPLTAGITTFAQNESNEIEETFASILETIDDHHGEYSHDPPWNLLEVFGISLSRQIEEETRKYGFNRFKLTEDGFIAFVE